MKIHLKKEGRNIIATAVSDHKAIFAVASNKFDAVKDLLRNIRVMETIKIGTKNSDKTNG